MISKIGRSDPAVLNVPAIDSKRPSMRLSCFVKRLEGDRLMLVSQRRPGVPCGVSVEHGGTIFFGEAVRSIPTARGWCSEIRVKQTLTGSRSLMNLGKSLLAAGALQPKEGAPARQTEEQDEPTYAKALS